MNSSSSFGEHARGNVSSISTGLPTAKPASVLSASSTCPFLGYRWTLTKSRSSATFPGTKPEVSPLRSRLQSTRPTVIRCRLSFSRMATAGSPGYGEEGRSGGNKNGGVIDALFHRLACLLFTQPGNHTHRLGGLGEVAREVRKVGRPRPDLDEVHALVKLLLDAPCPGELSQGDGKPVQQGLAATRRAAG